MFLQLLIEEVYGEPQSQTTDYYFDSKRNNKNQQYREHIAKSLAKRPDSSTLNKAIAKQDK